MLESLFNVSFSQQGGISMVTVTVSIILSFILSLAIAWIYKRNHDGLSYSKTFTATLVLMSVLIAVVMLVVGNNVAKAFTLLGAFTIIRFRTPLKDPKDMAFVFWALVTGMAVGTGSYGVAVISTALIAIIVFVLNKFKFGSMKRYDHLLTFILDTRLNKSDAYKYIFDKYLKESNMINVVARDSNIMDFTFSIRLFKMAEETEFINELKSVVGISNINLIASSKDAEY